ncbi:MAG TPA: terminase family protein [Clostridia bacterium]|nr:terminase family protein [Clostridia bacterium]
MIVLWQPQPVQEKMLSSSVNEVLFGGAKGGGKSDALLFGALRYIDRSNYKALIVRRTFPRLKEIIDRSMVFSRLGGKYNKQEKTWQFYKNSQRAGKISFGHCQNTGDEYNYQGHQYHYIAFDQVEEFSENMFTIISACGRKTDDTPVYIRATANPGGEGKVWVRNRWIKGKSAERVYFTENCVEGKTVKLSSMFIPATVYDNHILLAKNPEYVAFLMNLPDKYRKMYLYGQWDIEDDPDQLVSFEFLERGYNNGLNKGAGAGGYGEERIFLGVDVARFGDDTTEIAYLRNDVVTKIESYEKLDIVRVAGIVEKKILAERICPENIGIDVVGLGAGVYDILRSKGYPVVSIGSGERPLENSEQAYRYKNLRAQMCWSFREKLRLGETGIGIRDSVFEEEALAVRYFISNEREIQIESKEEIKKRLGRSPNKFDAAVYAVFVEELKNGRAPRVY